MSEFFCTPSSNTGGLNSELYSHFVSVNGVLKEVLLKKGSFSSAFIDTLTVVFPEYVFVRDDQLGSQEEVAANASALFIEIFGFGILRNNKTGRNGYKVSYHLGTDSENYGFFAMSGRSQNGTVCLFLTGVGLTVASDGWERRLYDFIVNEAPSSRITRCDLAHDFLDGGYSPEQALEDWRNGLFTSKNTRPMAECVGGDWLEFRGTGKTFYVGSRKNSSRFVRVYEKGRQLGDVNSNWVRVELELHNRDIIIPHDILINAGQYLNGSFPVFERLFHEYSEVQSKFERVKKQKKVSAEHCIKYGSIQVSGVVNLLQKMGHDSDSIVEILKNGKDKMPRRLNPDSFRNPSEKLYYINQYHRIPRDINSILDLTFDNSKDIIKHRTLRQYLDLVEEKKLKRDLGFFDTIQSEDEYFSYMWLRYATPSFLLNRSFKNESSSS